MQFKVARKLFLPVVKTLADVSTKAIMPEYTAARKLTLQVSDGALFISTSNGFLDVKNKFSADKDENLKTDLVDGICTVDSGKFVEIVDKFDVSNKTSVLVCKRQDNFLVIQDGSGKSKRTAQIPVMEENHVVEIKMTGKGDKFGFPTAKFATTIGMVAPFVGQIDYKLEYGFLCLDFKNEELMCACGDGALFAIAHARGLNLPVEKPFRRMLPVDQMKFVLKLIDGSENLDIMFKNETTVLFKNETTVLFQADNGMQMSLKGIPKDVPYASYEKWAFRHDDAKYAVDLSQDDLRSAMEFMSTAEDKEQNDATYFLCCNLTTSDDNSSLTVKVSDKNKYKCNEEIPCRAYKLSDLEQFNVELYADILLTLSKQGCASGLRFFLIEENGLLNAQSVDFGEEKNTKGMATLMPAKDNISLYFFFGAVRESV